jgi:hypothetical protein
MDDPNRILDYSTPATKRSIVPLLGVVACLAGLICGIAVIGFGVWWIAVVGTDGVLQGSGIGLCGLLIVYLCVKWYRSARRAMISGE